MREVNEGGGHNSLPPVVHFGLGDATNVEVLRIEWPSGMVQELQNVPAKQTLTITEPPRLFAVRSGGSPAIVVKGGRGFSYTIQMSANLMTWTDNNTVTITNLNGTARVDQPLERTSPLRIYRAVSR